MTILYIIVWLVSAQVSSDPIVLYGKNYFQPLLNSIDEMAQHGTISSDDKKLIFLTDDIDEAMNYIQTYVQKNYTVKPRKRFWWLFEKR